MPTPVDDPATKEPAPRRGLLARHLRLEDLLVFVWLVLIGPILLPPTQAGPDAGGGRDILAGLLDLLAVLGLAACIGARSAPGVVSGLVIGTDFRYALGPLLGAFAFALDDTAAKLGLEGAADAAMIVGLVAVALLSRWRIPPLAAPARRALVTPFILATSGYFGGFLSGLAGIFDLSTILGDAARDSAGVVLDAGLGALGVLVFYVMLVFAPRQVAEREGSVLSWTVRFLVFVLALTVGATWSGLRAG
jgi:hypothetical protein